MELAFSIFLLSALAGLFFPRISTLVFLLLLPIFGNRPGSLQACYILLLSSALILSVSVRVTSLKSLRSNNFLLVSSVLYLLASTLSLTSLPWREIVLQWYARVPALSDWSAWAHNLYWFFTPTEERAEYSILSVIWTTLSLLLALNIHSLIQRGANALSFAWAIFGGLVCALLVGLLDYYSVIDLRLWRALDPVVNPGDIQFRLQSFFGHSGWFAEYVTLSIPFVLVLLTLPVRFSYRVLLILSVLLVGEFILILTFQRGGWLSYPLTLLVVWGAIYIYRKVEQGEQNFLRALRSSFLKVVMSLPVTLIISLGVLWGFSKWDLFGESRDFHLTEYAQRFRDIQKTSDRTDFARAGWKLGLLHPFLGSGSESFAYQYRREFLDEQGHYFREIDLPLHGSAHNVYFQTFAGKGFIGLATLLLLVGGMAFYCFRLSLFESRLSHRSKLLLLTGASSASAFLIYGNVQEVFYIQVLQFLFFATVGIVAACAGPFLSTSRRFVSASLLLLTLAFGAQLIWNAFHPAREVREYGCYAPEKDGAGHSFRWCGPRARLEVPLEAQSDAEPVHIRIAFAPTPPTASPQTFQVWNNAHKIIELPITGGRETILDIPRSALGGNGHIASLEFRTAHYFIPQRDDRGSRDSRVLSLKVYEAHAPL